MRKHFGCPPLRLLCFVSCDAWIGPVNSGMGAGGGTLDMQNVKVLWFSRLPLNRGSFKRVVRSFTLLENGFRCIIR